MDGLRNDLKSMIPVSRPKDFYTAIYMALVQEEVGGSVASRQYPKQDWSSSSKIPARQPLPLPTPPRTNKSVVPGSAADTTSVSSADSKLAAVKAFRRAMGLCYRCGEKWRKEHKCGPQVQLHFVQELWDMLQLLAVGFTFCPVG